MTESAAERIRIASEELAAMLHQEDRALAASEPPAVLSAIVRAKGLLADRLLAARRAFSAARTTAEERDMAAQALAELMPVLERNAAQVRRKLDLVQGLVSDIELQIRRTSGRLVSIYEADGATMPQQPSPVSLDARL